jgi:hypothetical protein
MVQVRFAPGQWVNPGAHLAVRPSDRPALKEAIEAHLGKRFERAGADEDRVVGRVYRVPQALFFGHLMLVKWAEYEVVRMTRPGRFLVRLTFLHAAPLPDGPLPVGPAGADSDQGVESPATPPSPVSEIF